MKTAYAEPDSQCVMESRGKGRPWRIAGIEPKGTQHKPTLSIEKFHIPSIKAGTVAYKISK